MSIRNTRPQNRRARRDRVSDDIRTDPYKLELPGPLRLLTDRRVFFTMGIIFAVAIVASLFVGVVGSPSTSDSTTGQANELADVPRDEEGNAAVPVNTNVQIKRYTKQPDQVIDASKTYTATITTSKGDIQMRLFPSEAPEAVNAFVFLARDGYYNGTPFMELVKDASGGKFYTQAGDPTRTGLGTPGFSIKKEQTDLPFAKGAVGMGGASSTSNGGQFFISFGDYPSLTGKYTIFGQITSGADVLERLSLLDVKNDPGFSGADQINSITITEN
jgi:cyclophilin family peptidyl-prolyl cis-trans isomerase